MLNIRLEIDTLKNESRDLLEDVLNNQELLNNLNEVLEKEKSVLKISLEDENIIKIEEKRTTDYKDKNEIIIEKSKEVSKVSKFIKSFYKIFESFFDSVAKNFLKKKYKINNSVYNDGKKAIVAISEKDTKTFFKKVTDSLLGLFKKIPGDTKKIIKNTKNVAIDEIYSWNMK